MWCGGKGDLGPSPDPPVFLFRDIQLTVASSNVGFIDVSVGLGSPETPPRAGQALNPCASTP